MQTQTFTPEKTAQALATIERNAKLQAQLIEDLLDVSRILRGKMVLNVEPINLVTIIEAAIETVRLAAESKGITLRLVVSDGANQWERGNMNLWERGLNGASPPLPLPSSCPPVIEVWGDSARLQQIVWNLLTNAVKFTPYAGQVEVQLAPVGDGEWGVESGTWQMGAGETHLHTDAMDRVSSGSPAFAQITVSDTGKGIDPNFLPHVFDYFRQEDGATTRKFGGLGLGLAIVRHLTEQHGGTIQADSPGEGQGATFTVRLPLLTRRRSEAIDEGQDPDSPMTSSQHPLAGLRILVVDDEADMRELMLTVLETYGAQVSIVQSAKEALRLLQQTQPDLLISDIGMPDMDGYMLIQQVRKLPPDKGRYIPAIALTAYASEFDQQQALAAGFQQHIAKPVEPDVLVEAIATLLRL
ncbi:response regulator [Oscillatoria sp. FACHB-1407]|nr:response regulator [Oscillatoria sp. FACHB-1407]